jgi:hypothetical protein
MRRRGRVVALPRLALEAPEHAGLRELRRLLVHLDAVALAAALAEGLDDGIGHGAAAHLPGRLRAWREVVMTTPASGVMQASSTAGPSPASALVPSTT